MRLTIYKPYLGSVCVFAGVISVYVFAQQKPEWRHPIPKHIINMTIEKHSALRWHLLLTQNNSFILKMH